MTCIDSSIQDGDYDVVRAEHPRRAVQVSVHPKIRARFLDTEPAGRGVHCDIPPCIWFNLANPRDVRKRLNLGLGQLRREAWNHIVDIACLKRSHQFSHPRKIVRGRIRTHRRNHFNWIIARHGIQPRFKIVIDPVAIRVSQQRRLDDWKIPGNLRQQRRC